MGLSPVSGIFICAWNLLPTDFGDLRDVNHERKRDLRCLLPCEKNPLNPFNLCSENITKWKIYDVSENGEFRERFFLMTYMQFSGRCLFSLLRFFFLWKFSGTDFLVVVKTPSSARAFAKNFCFVKKEAQVSEGIFRTSLFFRNKTLPSLVIIENSDFCDAAEWGALNRKSRLL